MINAIFWTIVVLSFAMSYSIGANDAANALELAAMLERTDDLMLPLQRLHTVIAATNDALHHRLHHTSRPE